MKSMEKKDHYSPKEWKVRSVTVTEQPVLGPYWYRSLEDRVGEGCK